MLTTKMRSSLHMESFPLNGSSIPSMLNKNRLHVQYVFANLVKSTIIEMHFRLEMAN